MERWKDKDGGREKERIHTKRITMIIISSLTFFHHIALFNCVLDFLNLKAFWLSVSVLSTSNSIRSPLSSTFSIYINIYVSMERKTRNQGLLISVKLERYKDGKVCTISRIRNSNTKANANIHIQL